MFYISEARLDRLLGSRIDYRTRPYSLRRCKAMLSLMLSVLDASGFAILTLCLKTLSVFLDRRKVHHRIRKILSLYLLSGWRNTSDVA